MKNYVGIIIGILFTIALFLGLAWLGRPAPGKVNTGANLAGTSALNALVAEEQSFDFGTISMAAGNVSHAFRFKNTGNEPVAVTKLYTSCMCTTASLLLGDDKIGPFGMPGHGYIPSINKIIAGGEEGEIEVVFDPRAHGPAGVGPVERMVYLEQKGRAPLEVGIKAVVAP